MLGVACTCVSPAGMGILSGVCATPGAMEDCVAILEADMLRVGEEGRGFAPGYCIADEATLNIEGEGEGACAGGGKDGGGCVLAPGLDGWRARGAGAGCDAWVGVWEVGVDEADALLVDVLIAGVFVLELELLWR